MQSSCTPQVSAAQGVGAGNTNTAPSERQQSQTSPITERGSLINKPIRAPPRTKRQSIKPSPSVRKTVTTKDLSLAVNESETFLQTGHKEEPSDNAPSVVMRKKSEDSPVPADRSSRPPRGTLMLAVGDLFSRVKEEEQPKFVRRKTPQWTTQLLTGVSPHSHEDESAESNRSSDGSGASGTTGCMDVVSLSSSLNQENSTESEIAVSPRAAPSVQPRVSDELQAHETPVQTVADRSVTDDADQTHAVSPSKSDTVTEPGSDSTMSDSHNSERITNLPSENEKLLENAKDSEPPATSDCSSASVYEALWSSHTVTAGIGGGLMAHSAPVPLARKGSTPVVTSSNSSPKLARRPSEPPPAPPAILSASPGLSRKLLPVRPPPPVPQNKVKTEPPARPPPPCKSNTTAVDSFIPGVSALVPQIKTLPQKELPKVPSSSSLDEQIYTDIDENDMHASDVYVDPESVDEFKSNNPPDTSCTEAPPPPCNVTTTESAPDQQGMCLLTTYLLRVR